jgi:hypothetical protein
VTIAQHITDLWPQTEATLTAAAGFDYLDARDRAVTSAIAALWARYLPGNAPPDVATVEALSDVVQQQVAWQAVLLLMPQAKDYYKEQQKARAVTVDGGVTGSETLYDKLAALDGLAAFLTAQVTANAGLVAVAMRATVTPPAVAARPTFFAVAAGGRGR